MSLSKTSRCSNYLTLIALFVLAIHNTLEDHRNKARYIICVSVELTLETNFPKVLFHAGLISELDFGLMHNIEVISISNYLTKIMFQIYLQLLLT